MIKKLVILATAILFSISAQAQSSQIDNIGDNLSYREISSQLKSIEDMAKSEKPNIKALVGKVSYLNQNMALLSSSRQNIDSEIKLIEKRIEALGNKGGESSEARIIAQKRQEFNKELNAEKTRLSEIDILIAKIEELNSRILDLRNQRIWGNLLNSGLIFINPSTLLKVNGDLLGLLADIVRAPASAYTEYKDNGASDFGLSLFKFFAVMALIIVIGYYLRRFVIVHWGYGRDIENLRLGQKISASLAVWCAYGIIPTLILLYCWYHLNLIAFWSNDLLKLVLRTSLYYILFVVMGRAIARVILTPYNEKWRLIKISTPKAKKLFKAINFTIYTLGLFSILLAIAATQKYSPDLVSYLMALSATLSAACMVLISYIYFTADEPSDSSNIKAYRIGMTVTLFALTVIGLAFCGYSKLAFFIVNNTLISLVAIFIYTILRRLIYDAARRILFMGLWIKGFGVRRIFLRKIDFWFGIAIEPLMTLLLICGLLVLWGVPTYVLQNWIYKAISGFTVGGVKISLISVFWGILAFVICLWVIRFLQGRIEYRLLEKTSIDDGTKHSLASGFAYIGYCLAALLAIAIMGGNLTNIAMIASALSVGIGLGLQDIVNNFISGIIMLFERPIKVGDWVVINGEEGQVKQINIRSTEIETFNRSSLLIPNSKVLSNSVTNLTHQNNWVRYGVKVGVAYGSDVEKVKKVLLECVASHPKVAKKPAPYVLFQDFGSSSLDFEVRFYINDVWSGWTTPSDIRFIISKRFEKEGIEIPFTQIVLHQAAD